MDFWVIVRAGAGVSRLGKILAALKGSHTNASPQEAMECCYH